jgi:hypothetical protein
MSQQQIVRVLMRPTVRVIHGAPVFRFDVNVTHKEPRQ